MAQQLAQLEAAGCAKISGASAERPQLKRAIGALNPGDVLMVRATDHLARNTRDLLNILLDRMEDVQQVVALRGRKRFSTFSHIRGN